MCKYKQTHLNSYVNITVIYSYIECIIINILKLHLFT